MQKRFGQACIQPKAQPRARIQIQSDAVNHWIILPAVEPQTNKYVNGCLGYNKSSFLGTMKKIGQGAMRPGPAMLAPLLCSVGEKQITGPAHTLGKGIMQECDLSEVGSMGVT